jgi:WhiB family redox-sensing transcriptional regulator
MESLGWMEEGECLRESPELFYPTEHGRTAEDIKSLKVAKAICHECPVEEECLRYALRHEMEWGVWGGLSAKERRRILHPKVKA